jgi:hypothetical protein
MPTIYDEIKSQFTDKLKENSVKNKIQNQKLDTIFFDLGIDVLIKQIKALRKNNFEETKNIVGTDANELIRTIDIEIQKRDATDKN